MEGTLSTSNPRHISAHGNRRAAVPWIWRLAAVLVRPLFATPTTPNQLTAASLASAIAAAAAFATGEQTWMSVGAALFMAAHVLDDMDGALARHKGLASRFGERFDQTADTLGYALMFAGIAVGLSDRTSGHWLMALAAVAIIGGVANTVIRIRAETREGRPFHTFRSYAGFQLDDGIYLIGPATWFGFLMPFFVLLCLGAAVFGLWTLYSVGFRAPGRAQRQ